jgi:hypothetical protein
MDPKQRFYQQTILFCFLLVLTALFFRRFSMPGL